MTGLALYLIAAENEESESLDWMVSAPSPEEAVRLWREGVIELVDEVGYQGEIIPSAEFDRLRLFRSPRYGEFARIFLVQISGNVGVLNWDCTGSGGSMNLIGYLEP